MNVEYPCKFVAHVVLNNPQTYNAMNNQFWKDMQTIFRSLSENEEIRVILLSANGKHFTSGLDLKDLPSGLLNMKEDAARTAFAYRKMVLYLQETFNVIERCNKPVIALVHGHCIGGGMDLISACDVRYATSDAKFSVKEIDIGLAADLGTLQRMPKIVKSESWMREIAFSGRLFDAKEARDYGLLSRLFESKEEMNKAGLEMGRMLAGKSPVALQGTKHNLLYSRDHSVEEGLQYIATWNAAMLQTSVKTKNTILNQGSDEKKRFRQFMTINHSIYIFLSIIV